MLEVLLTKWNDQRDMQTTYLWEPKKKTVGPIWYFEYQAGKRECQERICSAARLNEHLFLGLENGYVIKIKGNGEVVKTYGPRSAATSYNQADDRIRFKETKVTAVVAFEGKIYDGSSAGLYETETEKCIDDRQIGAIELFRGQLCIIPFGIETFAYQQLSKKIGSSDFTFTKRDIVTLDEIGMSFITVNHVDSELMEISTREANAGSLVDPWTKQVLIKGVRSTHCQRCIDEGTHAVTSNRVYTKRREDIRDYTEVKDVQTGRVIASIRVGEELEFLVHNDRAYDCRREFRTVRHNWWNWFLSEQRATWSLYPSDLETRPENAVYRIPEGWKSAGTVSGGEVGILIALYNKEKDCSKIVSHLEPRKVLKEMRGYWTIERIR